MLISLYIKEKPEYFRRSLDSIFGQTMQPDQVVLVVDGPITEDLEKVISDYTANDILDIYYLKQNVGLGNALNYGLEKCKNELIMRMDTDDICSLNRAEMQITYLKNNPQISVLGTSVNEITTSGERFIKSVPEKYSDIKNQITKKNPMNHPSVVYRKEDVLSVGGYIELKLNEDYFLWLRMIQKGYLFENLSEPLVTMQVTEDTYLRRGGVRYFFTQNSIYKYMLKNKLINHFEYMSSFILRFILRICLPNKIRKYIYIKLLRKQVV